MGNELSVCETCCTTGDPPKSGYTPLYTESRKDVFENQNQMGNKFKTQNNTEAREGPHLSQSANDKTLAQADAALIKGQEAQIPSLVDKNKQIQSGHLNSSQSGAALNQEGPDLPMPCPPSPRQQKQQAEAAAGVMNGCGGQPQPIGYHECQIKYKPSSCTSPPSGILRVSTLLETSAAIHAASTSAPTPLASASPSDDSKQNGGAGVHHLSDVETKNIRTAQNEQRLRAFYRKYRPDKEEMTGTVLESSTLYPTIQHLNSKLRDKYGADLSDVSIEKSSRTVSFSTPGWR